MSYEPTDITRIQWVWGNRCNYDCAYCPSFLHNNKFPIPDHEQFLEAIDYMCRLIRLNDKQPVLIFTGGEPSQLPFLGTYLKVAQGNMSPINELYTNGSGSIEWFEQVIPFYNYIEISYHPEWARFDHIVEVVEFITSFPETKDYCVVVNVDNDDNRWINGVSAYNRFLDLGIKSRLKLLYSDFTKGNTLYPYKTYQLEQYYASIGKEFDPEKTVYRQDGIIEKRQRHDINKEKLENTSYNFQNQTCYTGIEQLVVMHTGDVYKGYCKVGGKLGNVFERNVILPSEPVTCPFEYCRNGFDKEATKLL